MTLTAKQVEYLLRPIHSSRVLRDNKGMAHVSQQDIRAHLNRIFGFAGWSSQVTNLTLVAENRGKDRDGKDKGWAVTYRCTLRLTVRDPEGNVLASYEDAATGTSPNLPSLGDGHDFACKVAVSMALKRCATNLGDGFGLSLYNKGQTSPLVMGTLVNPGENTVVPDEVEQQVSMGHDDAGSVEPEHAPERVKGDASEQTAWTEPVRRPPFDLDRWAEKVGQATDEQALRGLWDEARKGCDPAQEPVLRGVLKTRADELDADRAREQHDIDNAAEAKAS